MWRDSFEFGAIEERDLLEGEVARRTVRMGTFICGIAGASFALLYWLTGPAEFVAPNVIAAAVLWAISATRSHDATVPLYVAITLGLAVFGYQLLLLARVDNGIAVWFVVPNIAAMILGMRRLATYCASVTALIIVGTVLAARFGWIVPRVTIPQSDVVMAASMVSVLVVCGLFATIALRARERLSREVAARTNDLTRALEESRLARNEAVEAARSKESFFANLTHEIRTPLNGIAGTAELLQHTELDARQRPLAAALKASTDNLAELVNAMLDHAKLAARHVAVDGAPVEPRRLVAEVGSLFRARAAEKGLALVAQVAGDTPQWVSTDAMKLRQIIVNLVSNAVKFTARGRIEIRLRCDTVPQAGDHRQLVVEVADSGTGIAAEQQARIFEPFVQGDSSIARAYGGTGLGLAIARQLAELLGGSIELVSTSGEGAVFTLRLPVLLAAAPAAPVPEQTAPAAGLRVLLVEDNPVNQLVSRAMLETLDAQVSVADSGLAAVALAERCDFDLILMDLQMPGMDGIAAANEIRRRQQATGRRAVPIIALTGNSPGDYGDACAAAGMDGFMTKPVGVEQFRSMLQGLQTPP